VGHRKCVGARPRVCLCVCVCLCVRENGKVSSDQSPVFSEWVLQMGVYDAVPALQGG